MEDSVNQTVFALLPITLLGCVLNWCIFYGIHKLTSFNNSFGYLSANQALADALHSTTFLLYFCPMVLLFLAAWTPYQYDVLFSLKSTRRLIVLLWIFTGSVAYFLYQHLCHLYYEEKIHFFAFTNSELCGMIGWYGDFLKNAAIVVIIVCVDILTVLRVRYITKKV
ncbi:hypothetical protein CAEBREN_31535 [Caenorhabditis brenneri]|uniref:7TM GPCR serpentine receptor class x (Srx) domain-containing protein n=1 Tax=Caenorhabditis brenneri TaxID=135651 RepID=G0NHR0_CAEBE|nr:hypothetical protein CAEBREN_31535 [Caenorhabditis brenneri]